MNRLVESILDAGFEGRIFTERQLARVIDGSNASRYGLVNRALKDGSLVRIKRGVYYLAQPRHRQGKQESVIHPFAIAQSLVPGSYISFETALAYHGWIPEAVYETASITPTRKSVSYNVGSQSRYSFSPVALNEYQFLVSVRRVKFGKLTALVAHPLRALMDLVAVRKEHWQGQSWIEEGMRVDLDALFGLSPQDFEELKSVYKHKAAKVFLDQFQASLMALKSDEVETTVLVRGMSDD